VKKTLSVETEKRIDAVSNLLLSGASRRDVIAYVLDEAKWPTVTSVRAVDVYIAHANRRFEALSEPMRKAAFGRAVARREALFLRCMKTHDYKTALATDKDLCNLLGLYPRDGTAPPEIAVGVSVQMNSLFLAQTSEEMGATLARLQARGLILPRSPATPPPTIDAQAVIKSPANGNGNGNGHAKNP
jgi:hypothetical protein